MTALIPNPLDDLGEAAAAVLFAAMMHADCRGRGSIPPAATLAASPTLAHAPPEVGPLNTIEAVELQLAALEGAELVIRSETGLDLAPRAAGDLTDYADRQGQRFPAPQLATDDEPPSQHARPASIAADRAAYAVEAARRALAILYALTDPESPAPSINDVATARIALAWSWGELQLAIQEAAGIPPAVADQMTELMTTRPDLAAWIVDPEADDDDDDADDAAAWFGGEAR